jgi:hypothetical protein
MKYGFDAADGFNRPAGCDMIRLPGERTILMREEAKR